MTNVKDIEHTVEVARRLGQLGQQEEACQAYTLALHQLQGGGQPDLELEAALYLLQNGKDYKIAYTTFLQLYKRGLYQEDLLGLMTGAFYEPNIKQLKSRYEKNCKLLAKYPYLFRKDFLPFDQLPIQFFPFDDKGYLPFSTGQRTFGEYVNFNDPVVSRNFFKDLEKPILADDVYSMYELSYLKDNVRKSEWVGRENHIYLHYTDWAAFCAHLQVLDMKPLLEEKKLVFLIEDEISQYPIDFKERFGMDYSQYPVKPIGIREINRLIWHTQLSAHNGGDFFNEIFDGHPNLIVMQSYMLESMEELVENTRDYLAGKRSLDIPSPADGDQGKLTRLMDQLRQLGDPSDKDILVFLFLCIADLRSLDLASRIAPTIFFQPHFPNIYYFMVRRENVAVLDSEEYQQIRKNPIFTDFPYVKTFTPIRRLTTSYAASVKYTNTMAHVEYDGGKVRVVSDLVTERVLNRSFMYDPQDRLFQDSVLVRFEDGKLNPKATFTALASFLDLPYTESLTYCSDAGQKDPHADDPEWYTGFELTGVYKTYDEYAGKPERYFLEYFMRDVYEYCGYDLQYYDGAPMDMDRIREMVRQFTVQDRYIRETMTNYFSVTGDFSHLDGQGHWDRTNQDHVQMAVEKAMQENYQKREHIAELLLQEPRFINRNGQPLRMMPMLRLDPELLEQPRYH